MNQTRFDRIDALLEDALAVKPAARASWLKEACGADEALRREVEALLGLEEVAAQLPEHADLAGVFAEEAAAFTGQQLSHYRIEERLGVGGMGEVWRAWDELLKRAVALKFLPAAFNADPERVRRFEQEANAASQLNHPNIITIHEIGEAGGAHFIATEYVEGQTLRRWLTDPETKQPRRLSVAQTLDFAIQIASALKAAHAAWIVHRDIKPENIMVRGDGLVKVLDFGIAKLNEKDEGGRMKDEAEEPPSIHPSSFRLHPSLTATGTILGTASYMSPEQARGETLDGRTDVFSLGLVLYEMITGARLLAGATLAEATNSLLSDQEPLLAHAKFDHAPKELERVIRKTLRRDRAERYASAGELLDDLNRLKEQLANRASRRLVKVAALGLLLAALFVVAAAKLSVHETWDERVLRDGHTAAVRQAVFSPDGRRLVSGGEDGQVIVWNFARRERLAIFKAHAGWVTSVAFSPDGKWFATSGDDQTVIVWDAVRLAQVTVLREHQWAVASVAFSPDGRRLAACSGGSQGRTILWESGSWRKASEAPLKFSCGNLVFSPDGRRLMSSSALQTWDLIAGKEVTGYLDPSWGGIAAAVSPDARSLVNMGSGGLVKFVDLTKRRLLGHYRVHQSLGGAVAFSPNGRWVASGAGDIVLWEAATRTKLARFEHAALVRGLAFSPDGRWLVSTHEDGAILLWDVVERERVANFNEHSAPVFTVAWAPDGKRLASASEDRSVIIWDAATGRKDAVLVGHASRVMAVAFSSDGSWIASSEYDGATIVWDLARHQARSRFTYEEYNSSGLAISPDGRWVANTHGVYESAGGRQVVDLQVRGLLRGAISKVAFSADGRRLACVVSSYGQILLWDVEQWRLLSHLELVHLQLTSLSFSPDSKWLVTGENEQGVRLWQVEPLQEIVLLGRHAARIKSVAFSPDGTQVASAGDDKTIALWDVVGRKLITKIGLHTAPVYAVAFSPDGRQLISGEHDHSVRLYTRRRTLWGMNWD
jgi:WD40 repeat protein